MKKTLLVILFAVMYIWWLVDGYLSPMRGGWMFATALLYIMMHYVTLSWRDTVHKYGWIIWIFILVITGFIMVDFNNVWLGISILLWHVALRSVIYSLENELLNSRRFNKRGFFQTWGVLFSVLFTLSFITAFIWRNQQFTLWCDEIISASTSVITYTQEKFNISIHQVDTWADDLVTYIWGPSIEDHENNETTTLQNTWGLIGTISMYKQQLIDATLSNQKDVNMKVCQVFIDQIRDLYEKPGFRVSVILLMFLVISPLLRLTLYVISGLNILLFMLLRKMKVYQLTKETVEVDKIV